MNITGNFNALYKIDGQYLDYVTAFNSDDPTFAHLHGHGDKVEDEITVFDGAFLRENSDWLLIYNLLSGALGSSHNIAKYLPQRYPDESVQSYRRRTSRIPTDTKLLSSYQTLSGMLSNIVREAMDMGEYNPNFGNIPEEYLEVVGGQDTDWLTLLNNFITGVAGYGRVFLATNPAVYDKENKIIHPPRLTLLNPLQVTVFNTDDYGVDEEEPYVMYWENKVKMVDRETAENGTVRVPETYTVYKKCYPDRYIVFYREKTPDGKLVTRQKGPFYYVSEGWNYTNKFGVAVPPIVKVESPEMAANAKLFAYQRLAILIEKSEMSYMSAKGANSKINININDVEKANDPVVTNIRNLAAADANASINAEYITPPVDFFLAKQAYIEMLEEDFSKLTGLDDSTHEGAKTATEITKRVVARQMTYLSNILEVASPGWQKAFHLHRQTCKPGTAGDVDVRMNFSLNKISEMGDLRRKQEQAEIMAKEKGYDKKPPSKGENDKGGKKKAN